MDRVLGVVLLRAHPRNAFYVAKWTFTCPLRGSKMGRLGAVLGQFRRCWGHEVPFLRCFGQIWPRNAIYGTRAFVGAAPIFFALQVLHSGRFALFCRKQGAFMWVYVAVSRSDFYVFLRGSPYRLQPTEKPASQRG